MNCEKAYDKYADKYDNAFLNNVDIAENEYIFNLLKKYNPENVIDLGCGTGLFLDYIQPKKYIGIDISNKMLNIALKKHPGYQFKQSNMEDLSCFQEDVKVAEKENTEAYVLDEKKDGTVHVKAMSQKATEDIREREKILKSAKTREEKNMAMKSQNLYRISLIFSGKEADIVKSVLGKRPAEKILELCQQ